MRATHPNFDPHEAGAVRRLRAFALSRPANSPAGLITAGIVGMLVLVVFFLTGTVTAVSAIDEAAIAAERTRAEIALRIAIEDGAAMDDSTARALARDFSLAGARFVASESLASGETAIAVPGDPGRVLAWQPRLFATEAFGDVAPIRLGLGMVLVLLVGIILFRLKQLAVDLEARRRAAEELASRDTLTGLSNRLTFDEELRDEFALGRPERPLALLYLDLDGFKAVNDTLGHAAGDDLLRLVGARLTGLAGEHDMVARLGGDEFAFIRREATARAQLADLAFRIREALTAPFPADGEPVTIGVSIGIATADEDGPSASALVRAADAALYRAKAEGGAMYAFADGRGGARRAA